MKKIIIILIVGVVLVVGFLVANTQDALWKITKPAKNDLANQPLPASCFDEPEGLPVITSLSLYEVSAGQSFEVRGCNFSGFEGDLDIWIVNDAGAKGYLYGNTGSTPKQILITLESKICQQANTYSGLPCENWLELVPGKYKLYTEPWGKKSNEVNFIIK